MKSTTIAILCALCALLGGGAGALVGSALDRRAGDLNGVNLQMNEAATQLKVASALLMQLKQGDAATARDIVEQIMRSSKSAIEKGRANPALTTPTLQRVDEAVSLAATAEKS